MQVLPKFMLRDTNLLDEIRLQTRGNTEDNWKIIFSVLNENISCGPSLEPSR